jgi:hypothetical protein
VLAGGLAALVAGCGQDSDEKRAARPGRTRAPSDADAVLRRRAAADSAELVIRYDATAAAHPSLAAGLRPLRAELAEHIMAFGGATAASAAPAPSSAPPSPPRSLPPAVPPSADTALAALADAEQRLVDSRTTALLAASPDLARLLASVAAAGAGHVLLLRERT